MERATLPESQSERQPESQPAPEDILGFLRRHAPFDRMRAADLAFLADRLRPIRFAEGEAVTDPQAGPAEWFYILRQGRIRGEDAQGRPDGAWDLAEGACFPLGALAENRPVRHVRRAAGEALCLTMNRAAFDALRARSAVFAAHCARRFAGLRDQATRPAQAEAARDPGGDSALTVPLTERPLRPPVTAPPGAPLREALETMAARKIGSLVVADEDMRPLGIFTLKDLLNRVALPGTPLETPISAVMTPDPVSLPRTAFAFEAAMAMAHAGIRHICILDEGRLAGVVSERDLFSMQRVGLVNLSKSILRAPDLDALKRLGADIHQLVAQFVAQGMKVGQIGQIITLLNDQITTRVIDLTLAEIGAPEIAFAWLAFGSEGRQEQTLKTDQDNGILFRAPEGTDPDHARARLLPFADRVNVALEAVGFPLCPGDVMARNPACCLSEREWRRRFQGWVRSSTPENLLNASIFFDFRPVWGDGGPAEELRSWLLDLTADNALFRRQMAVNALRNGPALGGMFRTFRLSGAGEETHTIDLKVNGVTPFVDAARILALSRRVRATNTAARLEAAAAAGAMEEGDAAAWIEAYDYIRFLRMRRNAEQIQAGGPLGNRIDPDQLNDLDRRILREAFREARRLQQKLALDYRI